MLAKNLLINIDKAACGWLFSYNYKDKNEYYYKDKKSFSLTEPSEYLGLLLRSINYSIAGPTALIADSYILF